MLLNQGLSYGVFDVNYTYRRAEATEEAHGRLLWYVVAKVAAKLYKRARCPTLEDINGEKGRYVWRTGTYTRPEYQRSGIAKNLYRWALEQMRNQGFLGVYVQAHHPWMEKICL